MLRCCLSNVLVCDVLCGLQNPVPATMAINGGGDGTIVSYIFSVLSLCASSSNQMVIQITKNVNYPQALVFHSCLTLATIAQCLKSTQRVSASCMLTTTQKRQHSRPSVLAHLSSSDDRVKNSLQPQCALAMLALTSLISLESEGPLSSSISETALTLVPPTATLSSYLRLPDENEVTIKYNGMISKWHGHRDGCVGLLETRLKWGGPLAIELACSNRIPQLLIYLLADGLHKATPQGTYDTKDRVGLSPVGIVWTVSSICLCLSGGAFREILFRKENVMLITDLITAHLKVLKRWSGFGGGSDRVRDLINAVIDLLAFPFVAIQNVSGLPSTTASINSGFLLNMGSPGGRVCVDN